MHSSSFSTAKDSTPELSRRSILRWTGVAALAGSTVAFTGCASSAASPSRSHRAAQLFCTESGKGRNVLFLHGWGCDGNDWIWQQPAFEKKYRTITPDLRGHGRSEVTPSGTYMPDDFVADVEALMLSKANGGQFVLVGHSMGGQIAARVAAKRPDMVDGVVSIDGALGWEGAAIEHFRQGSASMKASSNPANEGIAMLSGVYVPNGDPGLKAWHARRLQATPAHVVREAFPPLFFGEGQVGDGAASRQFCESLRVPVLHLTTDPNTVTRMRPWFKHPKSQVSAVSQAGHWIMQDQPKVVNAGVMAWIDRL